MLQTIEEIFRACHSLPPLRKRSTPRPLAKAIVFAGLAGAIAILGVTALQ